MPSPRALPLRRSSNSGLISGVASANANAIFVANANAVIFDGIDQLAIAVNTGGPAAALASVSNAGGTIAFNAFANAGGVGTGTTFIPATTANAFAGVANGIDQFGLAVGTSALAVATVANAGAITVNAAALATATINANALALLATESTRT